MRHVAEWFCHIVAHSGFYLETYERLCYFRRSFYQARSSHIDSNIYVEYSENHIQSTILPQLHGPLLTKSTARVHTFASSDSYKSLADILTMERIASTMAAAAALPMAMRPGPTEVTASATLSAKAPIWAPMAEAASSHMDKMSGPKTTTAIANPPMIAAQASMKRMGIAAAPPMAMLWAIANKLPATTFPIIACIAAAKDPNKVSNSVHGKCSVLRHGQ